MSSPPNALDAYRTYSYHHILIAADSTATAEYLSEESELTRFDHPEVRFAPQPHPKGGQYIVLINGMTDAQFVVQSAKWSTVPIPTVGPNNPSVVTAVQTMAVDGEIEILEPQGINFFNVLANGTKLLGVDPAIVTFVLKTIFVGHRDDGAVNIISTVKPLLFMMVDITASIDVTGATYTMALVGVANGAAKLPHVNSIVNGMTIDVGETLGETILTILPKKITETYDKLWTKLTSGEGGKCGVKIGNDEFVRVNYEFDLDSHYVGMDAGNNYDDKFKSTDKKGGFVANLGDMASIENIISAIMMSSKQVADEAKSEKYMFKISSDIRTEPTGQFTVTYRIHRYEAIVVPPEQLQTFNEPEENNTGITFDYIFTGKNIDIIDMDIKMEFGLMFFQILSTQGTSPTSAMQLLRNYSPDAFVKGTGPAKLFADTGKDKEKVITRPLFLGTTLDHPMFRDTKSIGTSASFNTLLTRQAALETMGIQVKIRGNPQLLQDTTQLPKDLTTVASQTRKEQVIEPPTGDAEHIAQLREIMPTIHKTPAYVRINVWSPKSWTNTRERTTEEVATSYEGDFAENLWYKGWYRMIQIDNEFEDGEFSQTLELLSLPTELPGVDSDSKCKEKQEDEENREATYNKGGAGTPGKKVNVANLAGGHEVLTSSSEATSDSRANDADNTAGTAKHKYNTGGN